MEESIDYHPCCQALDAPETCVHKDLYLRVEEYVKSQGVSVGYAPDGAAADSWKVSTVWVKYLSIAVWREAYEIYGWDMVTSTLIHEFASALARNDPGLLTKPDPATRLRRG